MIENNLEYLVKIKYNFKLKERKSGYKTIKILFPKNKIYCETQELPNPIVTCDP